MRMSVIKPKITRQLACLLASSLSFGYAFAQALETNGSNASAMPEIIVTALRREQPLFAVPISVAVFDESEIEGLKLLNIAEVARYAPNVEWDQTNLGSANTSSVFIRGIGTPPGFFERTADPSVGIYVDGVYMGRTVGSISGVHDVAQIEVLRGPQGTLFGRNTTGGAITVRTNRPTSEFSGWGDLTTGSYSRLDARITLNVPINDSVMTRFSASSLNQDGYGDSLVDGTAYGDIDNDALHAALRWLPGETWTVDLIVDWSRARQGSPANTLLLAEPGPLTLSGAYNFFVAPTNSIEGFGDGVTWDEQFLTDSAFTNYATGDSLSDVESHGFAAIVEWRPNDFLFKSITSYRELDSDWAVDVDLSPLVVLEDRIRTDQWQFSQEFTLQGLLGQLDWLAGIYYFEEEAEGFDNVAFVPEVMDVESDPLFGVPNPLFGIPLATNGMDQPAPTGRASSVAAFARVTYDFSGKLKGFLGLRYTSEDKEAEDPLNFFVPGGPSSASFTDTSPTIGLQYFPDPGLQLYGSVSQGFKSGGYSTLLAMPTDEFPSFEPEEVTAYEAGIKMQRERLSLAAALFFNDFENIQVPLIQATPRIANAAEAETKGFELDLLAAVTDEFSFSTSVGYLDAEYKSIDPSGPDGAINPLTLDSILPNAPRWSVNLGLQYEAQLRRWGSLSARADYAWRDETHKDALNAPQLLQDSFGLLYAAVDLESSDGRWLFTLFGDNLTDETYLLSGSSNIPQFGLVVGTYGRPRTWGLSARYSFGSASP
jgi:iron complex outermembrane receptor protein